MDSYENALKVFEEKLDLLLKTLQINKQLVVISIDPGTIQNSLSLGIKIDGRPRTAIGNNRQGAHTFAYSAIPNSIVRLFKYVTIFEMKKRLLELHKGLHAVYVTSAYVEHEDDLNQIKSNPYLRKNNIHGLKHLADFFHKKIYEQGDFLARAWLKLYLTTFVHLQNLLLDATVDQESKSRGEGIAFKRLADLEEMMCLSKRSSYDGLNKMFKNYSSKAKNAKTKNGSRRAAEMMELADLMMDELADLLIKQRDPKEAKTKARNIAIAYLSRLIDENALNQALCNMNYEKTSLVSYAIFGLSRLISTYPELSDLLSFDRLYLRDFSNIAALYHLTMIVFYKFETAGDISEFKHPNDFEAKKIAVEKAINWMHDAQLLPSSYGSFATS
jgi:hypothetical protein